MTLMYLPARISKLLSGMREFKKEKLFADYQIILPACCYDAHSTGARKCKYFVQGPRYLQCMEIFQLHSGTILCLFAGYILTGKDCLSVSNGQSCKILKSLGDYCYLNFSALCQVLLGDILYFWSMLRQFQDYIILFLDSCSIESAFFVNIYK